MKTLQLWTKVALAAFVFPASVAMTAQVSMVAKSTEVHPEGRVSFHYKDAKAERVALSLEGVAEPIVMAKDKAGVWSATTAPLAPEIYSYHFEVDGETRLDPESTNHVPNLLFHSNWVSVPGVARQLWEPNKVPHGEVHHHIYTSKVVKGLSAGQSDYFVYTPPGYDRKVKKPYPVLYLLHGWSDSADAWTVVGRANLILDNLIAEGRAKPMVVVMPLGYGEMTFVSRGEASWDDRAAIDRNVEGFSQALLSEVMPQVEAGYRVQKDAEGRAVAGLSMGGLESLAVGLNHPEQFAWVGGFSAAVFDLTPEKQLLKAGASRRLLWIACGTEEELIGPNRKLVEWLRSKNISVNAVETPGLHTWLVWRDNLIHFVPLLFQEK